MSIFYYDDDEGMLTDENGNKVVEYEMEVDNEQYLLTSIITFTSYLDLKPPEKSLKMTKTKEKPSSSKETNSDKKKDRTYRK
jgi:hypothetical protein